MLITPTQYTAFNVGVPFAISGFIAAIVGGFGHPLGAFMGGIMLGLAQSIAIVAFGAGLKNVAALSVLLIFLFIRPGGILGRKPIRRALWTCTRSIGRTSRGSRCAKASRARRFPATARPWRCIKLMPKHEPKPHKHTYEQLVYILAGHIRFHVGDKSVVLGPGGLLQIPPDVMHWGEVVGDEPVLNLDVFVPRRPEYA